MYAATSGDCSSPQLDEVGKRYALRCATQPVQRIKVVSAADKQCLQKTEIYTRTVACGCRSRLAASCQDVLGLLTLAASTRCSQSSMHDVTHEGQVTSKNYSGLLCLVCVYAGLTYTYQFSASLALLSQTKAF